MKEFSHSKFVFEQNKQTKSCTHSKPFAVNHKFCVRTGTGPWNSSTDQSKKNKLWTELWVFPLTSHFPIFIVLSWSHLSPFPWTKHFGGKLESQLKTGPRAQISPTPCSLQLIKVSVCMTLWSTMNQILSMKSKTKATHFTVNWVYSLCDSWLESKSINQMCENTYQQILSFLALIIIILKVLLF